MATVRDVKEKIKEMGWCPDDEEFWEWHTKNVGDHKKGARDVEFVKNICIEQYWGKEYAEDGKRKR